MYAPLSEAEILTSTQRIVALTLEISSDETLCDTFTMVHINAKLLEVPMGLRIEGLIMDEGGGYIMKCYGNSIEETLFATSFPR